MQERTPLSGNEVVLSRELGAALHQPTGIEQENDPTGLTTHLRAEIQQNMAALGPSSVRLVSRPGLASPSVPLSWSE